MEVLYVVRYSDSLYIKLNAIFGTDLVMFALPDSCFIKDVRVASVSRENRDEIIKVEGITGISVRVKPPQQLIYAFTKVHSGRVSFVGESEVSQIIFIVIPEWVYNLFSDRDNIEVVEMRTDLHFSIYDKYLGLK